MGFGFWDRDQNFLVFLLIQGITLELQRQLWKMIAQYEFSILVSNFEYSQIFLGQYVKDLPNFENCDLMIF